MHPLQGLWLDSMILIVFSNLNEFHDSMTLVITGREVWTTLQSLSKKALRHVSQGENKVVVPVISRKSS